MDTVPPHPPHHPVISLEAGPDLVPIPSGKCHLSWVPPAMLWLHHSTTIVIKTVIFVWGNKRDFFFSRSERKYCKTPSSPHWLNHADVSFSCAFGVYVYVYEYTECHQGSTGVLVPLLNWACDTAMQDAEDKTTQAPFCSMHTDTKTH